MFHMTSLPQAIGKLFGEVMASMATRLDPATNRTVGATVGRTAGGLPAGINPSDTPALYRLLNNTRVEDPEGAWRL